MPKKKMKAKARAKTPKKTAKVKAKIKKAKRPSKTRVAARKPVKKAAKRRAAKPEAKPEKQAPQPKVVAPPNSVLLGYIDDYFAKIGVIALTLAENLALGNRIQVIGHTTNFEQPVDSMQIDHLPVTSATAGQGVGIKVGARARKGDHVYLLH